MRPAKNPAATLRRDGRHAGDGSGLSLTHMRDDRLGRKRTPFRLTSCMRSQSLAVISSSFTGCSDASVVDQNVDLTEGSDHGFDGFRAGSLVGATSTGSSPRCGLPETGSRVCAALSAAAPSISRIADVGVFRHELPLAGRKTYPSRRGRT